MIINFFFCRYTPLDGCISRIPTTNKWPTPWPQRLKTKPLIDGLQNFDEDTRKWSETVTNVYLETLGVNWSSVRNVMDMNAGYGGLVTCYSYFISLVLVYVC